MKKLLPFIYSLLILAIISCNEKQNTLSQGAVSNEVQEPAGETLPLTDVKMDTQQPVEVSSNASIEEKEVNGQDAGNQTQEVIKQFGKISFKENTFDFGKLGHGKTVSNQFRFTNTGEAPLNIKNVNASCGCTVAKYSLKPIAPGEEGFIDVEFNSKGKMGLQRQTVTVITDGNPPRALLAMKGIVVPPGDEN